MSGAQTYISIRNGSVQTLRADRLLLMNVFNFSVISSYEISRHIFFFSDRDIVFFTSSYSYAYIKVSFFFIKKCSFIFFKKRHKDNIKKSKQLFSLLKVMSNFCSTRGEWHSLQNITYHDYNLLHYILIFGLFYQQLLGGNGTLKWSSKTCFWYVRSLFCIFRISKFFK